MAKAAYIGVSGKARKIKKGYIGVENFTKRTLPSGYTQVEYIQSSGTQCINMDVIPNQNPRVVLDIQLTSSATQHIFGARTALGSNSFFVAVLSATQFRADYADQQNTHTVTNSLSRTTLDISKSASIINGASKSFTAATFTPNVPMYLFASNTNGTIVVDQYKAKMRLYSGKVYDNGTLVRDFVPCKNSSGTIGLYDLVNGKFYANVGTGTFTAGAAYSSVARKIKKAYIGIGGVARPFWSGGELAYYGTATALSQARLYLAATTVGDYALFGGGQPSASSSGTTSKVDAYNTSLTHSTPSALRASNSELGAATVGDYAIFAGGITNTAYNRSLTISSPQQLKTSRTGMAATSVGNYAIFAGGGQSNVVDAYNASLTRYNPTVLSSGRGTFAATAIGNYALFGGGIGSSTSAYVDVYDTSLTSSRAASLSVARYYLAATSVGNYAIFAGGYPNTGGKLVEAYDASLTKSTPTELSVRQYNFAATTIGNYALFAGGTSGITVVDAYDESLTRTLPTELYYGRNAHAATTVGNYALFAGGANSSNQSLNKVEAYTIV